MARNKRAEDLIVEEVNPETGARRYDMYDAATGDTKKSDWLTATPRSEDLSDKTLMRITPRLKKLRDVYGDGTLHPNFMLDIANAPMDDRTMMWLARQQWRLTDRKVNNVDGSWWSALKQVPGIGDLAHASEVAWRPTGTVLSWGDKQADNISKWYFGNQEADWGQLVGYGILSSAGLLTTPFTGDSVDETLDAAADTLVDPETGRMLGGKEWAKRQGPVIQLWGTLGYIVNPLDPLNYVFPLMEARQFGKIVQTGETLTAAERAKKIAWKAKRPKDVPGMTARAIQHVIPATTPADVSRMMEKGGIKISDWFRGVPIRDIIRSSMGGVKANQATRPGKFRHLVETTHATDVAGLMMKIPALRDQPGAAKYLLKNKHRVADAVEDLYDADKFSSISKEIEALSGDADNLRRAITDLSLKPLPKRWSSITQQTLWNVRNTDPLKFKQVDDQLASWERYREIGDMRRRVDRTDEIIEDMQGFQDAFNAFEQIPTVTSPTRLRNWIMETGNVAMRAPRPDDIMDARPIMERGDLLTEGRKQIRRLAQNITAMHPHPIIEAVSDEGPEQLRRLGEELEIMAARMRRGGTKGADGKRVGGVKGQWDAEDTRSFMNRFINAKPEDRGAIVHEMQSVALRRIGLPQDAVDKAFEMVRQSTYKGADGKPVKYASSEFARQQLIPIIAVHELRDIARKGVKAVSTDEWNDVLRQVLRTGDRMLKTAAVVRPGWIARVVGISEQARNAMAGMPTPLTHPLLWLYFSGMKGSGAAGDLILGSNKLRNKIIGKNLLDEQEELTDLIENYITSFKGVKRRGAAWRQIREKGLGVLSPDTIRGLEVNDAYVWSALKGNRHQQASYKRGWLRALNESLANDPMTVYWNEGFSVTDVHDWTQLPEGAEYIRRVGVPQDDALGWVVQSKKDYDHLTKGVSPELRSKIGVLSEDDVVDLVPPNKLSGRYFDETQDRPDSYLAPMFAKEGHQAGVDRLMRKVWDSMSARPSFYASRVGAFQYSVLENVQGVFQQFKAKDIALNRRKMMLSATTGNMAGLSAQEQILVKKAIQKAQKQVKQVVYDLSETSRMADQARFVRWFGNAWQEEITRWAKLSYARPVVPFAMMNIWNSKENMPWSYKDKDGKDHYMIPYGDTITRAASGVWNVITGGDDGLSFPIGGAYSGLNILTGNGGLPGGGPYVQISADIARRWFRVPISEAQYDFLGVQKGKGMFDTITSNPWSRLARSASNTDLEQERVRIIGSVVNYAIYKADGDFNKVDVEAAKDLAGALDLIGATSNFLLGGGLRTNLPPELVELADEATWLRKNFPSYANDLFLQEHGERAAAFLVAATVAESGIPPTAEAEKLILAPDARKDAYHWKRAFWSVMSEPARGEIDHEAMASQIARGERSPRTAEGRSKAAQVIVGYRRLGKILDIFNEATAGYSTRSDYYQQVKELKRQQTEDLYALFPEFGQQHDASRGGTKYKVELRSIYEMHKDPDYKDMASMRGATQYFEMLGSVKKDIRARGWASLDSEQADYYRQLWEDFATSLARQNADWGHVYYQLGLDRVTVSDDELAFMER